LFHVTASAIKVRKPKSKLSCTLLTSKKISKTNLLPLTQHITSKFFIIYPDYVQIMIVCSILTFLP